MIANFDELPGLLEEVLDAFRESGDCPAALRTRALRWALKRMVSEAPTLNHAVAIICGELAEVVSKDEEDTLRKIFKATSDED